MNGGSGQGLDAHILDEGVSDKKVGSSINQKQAAQKPAMHHYQLSYVLNYDDRVMRVHGKARGQVDADTY